MVKSKGDNAVNIKKSVAATYRINSGVLDALSEYSSKTRRCKSTIVELAIAEYIEKHTKDGVDL